MAFLLSGRRVVFVAAGVGMLFGGCAACYIVRRKLNEQILSLNHQMALLRQEVDRLRALVEELLPPPRPTRIEKNSSFHNSSFVTSDDDDVYEDAYGGCGIDDRLSKNSVVSIISVVTIIYVVSVIFLTYSTIFQSFILAVIRLIENLYR